MELFAFVLNKIAGLVVKLIPVELFNLKSANYFSFRTNVLLITLITTYFHKKYVQDMCIVCRGLLLLSKTKV